MSNQEAEYQQFTGSNQKFISDSSFMRYRLDSEPILARIETFLKGTKRIMVRDPEGNFFEQEEEISTPLANRTGVNQLMNKLHTIINAQTVQGNLDTNHYYELIAEWRGDLKDDLIMNCSEWGIEDNKLDYIANTIMAIVETFFTRPINNKERDSYKETMVSRESISDSFIKKKGALRGILQ